MRYMSRPSHSSWFYRSHNIGRGVQIIKLSLCSFLHSLVTSFLLGPNILLNTKFPSDQVSSCHKFCCIACKSMHIITEKGCIYCISTWLTVNFRNVSICDLVQLQHRRGVHWLGAATMQHWWSDWCGEGIHHESGWWTLPHRIVRCECALVMMYNVILKQFIHSFCWVTVSVIN